MSRPSMHLRLNVFRLVYEQRDPPFVMNASRLLFLHCGTLSIGARTTLLENFVSFCKLSKHRSKCSRFADLSRFINVRTLDERENRRVYILFYYYITILDKSDNFIFRLHSHEGGLDLHFSFFLSVSLAPHSSYLFYTLPYTFVLYLTI